MPRNGNSKDKLEWFETWKARLFHRFPQEDSDGFIWLEDRPYVHNANLDVPVHYRPKRFLKLIELCDYESYWLENEPAQISFDKTLTPDSVGITGDTIKTWANANHANQILNEQRNMWAVAAIILGVVAAIGMIGLIINATGH
jgi:hypothetical protein